MDQQKIGKFIAECRKEKNLTQIQLADKLNITDRAVSKWENGKTMPDSSLMLELCDVLDITVNDLLCGEKVSSEQYTKKLEEQLVEVLDEKERSDKLLYRLAWALDIFLIFICITIDLLIYLVNLPTWVYFLSAFWVIIVYASIPLMLKAFRMAGYYKCENCGHIFTPTTKELVLAPGWTQKRLRFKCHNCNEKAYHKKVFRKE